MTSTNIPISDKVVRERTFDVVSHRDDKKDVLGQLAITVMQILEDKQFVGKIVLNCTGGNIQSIQTVESKRV